MEVEMKIRGLMMDPVTNMPIVVLKDVNGSAILRPPAGISPPCSITSAMCRASAAFASPRRIRAIS